MSPGIISGIFLSSDSAAIDCFDGFLALCLKWEILHKQF